MRDRRATILINRIKRRFYLSRLIETLLYSIGFSLLVFGLSIFIGFNLSIRIGVTIGSSILFFLSWIKIKQTFQISEGEIAKYISIQHPLMEYSTDLLVADTAKLNRLELLQKEKVEKVFASVFPDIKIRYALLRPMMVVLFGSLSAFLLSGIKTPAVNTDKISQHSTPIEVAVLPAEISDLRIDIAAPVYMQLQNKTQKEPNLKINEGSTVKWSFKFSTSVRNVYLIFSGTDSIPLAPNKEMYSLSRRFFENGFYQIGWVDEQNKNITSVFYRLEVVEDRAPTIEISNPPQFLDVSFEDDQRIQVSSILTDDWGIHDAYIIATVSKGSGESVKFREEKLLFNKPSSLSGKKVDARLQIDLKKLGLEPGDELYFYVVGLDNKQPSPNQARTETHFIVLQDTASNVWVMDAGLGVDLMPEYFRSQRQIIIDSEKLLRERKAISKQEFNSRSNELGYDQKLLRLKYGEFLGEEFESGITQQENHADEGGDPLAAYSHKHDVDEEHQEVVVPKKEGEKEDPLAAFTHKHDDSETATFFEQSIRAKLKAALAVMWDAELHLRLYDPEKSLPFQYRALKLLKEISNDSRIYVHKVGFDPPPVKEEKRLSGDLSEIHSKSTTLQNRAAVTFPKTKEALKAIEKLSLQQKPNISIEEKRLLQEASVEVAAAILENPNIPLQTLTILKNLSEDIQEGDDVKGQLLLSRKYLTVLLPNETETVGTTYSTVHLLERKFTQAVQQNK